jgi:acetyl-CoA carboxylase carboxyl transferase subunit beta
MPIADWFKKTPAKTRTPTAKRTIPDGVWTKCVACNEAIFQKELERNQKVCPKCQFHFPISASERIKQLVDIDSFEEHFTEIESLDPLNFKALKSYQEVLVEAKNKTRLQEAVVCGRALIEGRPVVLAVMDFSFIGGSMGSVVGEKVARAIELAGSQRLPLVTVSASGGARMQEGMFSLMQMAKTSAAMARFDRLGLPHISILTHPTTGGVLASFATLADILIAEPGALIGFTGPRVIEQTIRQRLPKDFQRAEFLLEHGQVDMVVSRSELKKVLTRLLDYLR